VAQERDLEFYREIFRKGGEKVVEERGSEFFGEIFVWKAGKAKEANSVNITKDLL
jgi:hypothetical protein